MSFKLRTVTKLQHAFSTHTDMKSRLLCLCAEVAYTACVQMPPPRAESDQFDLLGVYIYIYIYLCVYIEFSY